MNQKFVNALCLLLCTALFFASLNPGLAVMAMSEQIEEILADSEEVYQELLAEENLELTTFEFDASEEMIIITVLNEIGDEVTLNLSLDDDNVFAEYVSFEETEEFYKIEILNEGVVDSETAFEGELLMITEDLETGEVYDSSEFEGSYSATASVPEGIDLSNEALKLLLMAGLVILSGGLTFIDGSKAIPKITNNKNKKNHYYAHVVGKVYIGKGCTETQAVSRLNSGKSTWSISSNQAKTLVSKMAKGTPINEVDKINGKPKPGYYWHWHSATRLPKGHHAFYGNAI